MSRILSKELSHNLSKKWVVVELTSVGEKEKRINLIESSAKKILRRHDIEVFIPAVSQKIRDDNQTLFYIDGYVFIEYKPDISYLSLRETTYFNNVLCTFVKRVPQYSLLTDEQLKPLRIGTSCMKISHFEVGDTVVVLNGSLKNLSGCVSMVHDDNERVQVAVNLRTKKILIDFPSTYLRKCNA